MKHKVIINLPDCRIVKYQEQQSECYETWIPEVRKLGIEVIKSVSMEDLDSEYYLDGDSLFCRCTDKLDKNFTLKRYYFLKWALENREFDSIDYPQLVLVCLFTYLIFSIFLTSTTI